MRQEVQLKDAIEAWIAYSGTVERNTVGTLKNKRISGRHLMRASGNIRVRALSRKHVEAMLEMHSQWKGKTANLNVTNVRTLINFCIEEGWLDSDPLSRWRPVPEEKEVRQFRIEVEQFDDLLDAARHPRDRAAIAIGLFSLIRSSELVPLRWIDIDFKRKEFDMHRFKNRTDDTLPMLDELVEELLRYQRWYRKHMNGLWREDWYVVPAKEKGEWVHDPTTHRLVPRTGGHTPLRPYDRLTHVYTIVKRAMQDCGLPVEGEGYHTLRRSGARAMYEALSDLGHNRALSRVSSMLGHSNTAITERYLGAQWEREARNRELAGLRLYGDKRPAGKVIRLEGDPLCPKAKEQA